MLKIRSDQMKTFEEAAWLRFENEMVIHSREFSPKLCEVIGEAQLRIALGQDIKRAVEYGFTYQGPVRLYIELMFLFGSHFDTDPQYPMFAKVLNASGDQMERAEQIHEEVAVYLEKVSGADNIYVRKALENLSAFARKSLMLSSDEFVRDLLQEMTSAYPQKVAIIGIEALTQLIHEGRAEARKYGFSASRGEALMVVLMFAFGHGCTDDPLYPWISGTLKNEKIISPAARAERLEKKALTWLDHVLARPPEGAYP